MPVIKNKGGDPAVETDLARLAIMPIVQLRLRYREVFRTYPPTAFGPDLLRRSIAHRIQEKAHGGLTRPMQRLLDQLINAYAVKPTGKLTLPPRIKPGAILVRSWKNKSYRVTVMADGFGYEGRSYSNLSEIAVLITGTRWNGPKFFGLRSRLEKTIAPVIRKQPLGGGSDYRKRNAESKVNRNISAGRLHGS